MTVLAASIIEMKHNANFIELEFDTRLTPKQILDTLKNAGITDIVNHYGNMAGDAITQYVLVLNYQYSSQKNAIDELEHQFIRMSALKKLFFNGGIKLSQFEQQYFNNTSENKIVRVGVGLWVFNPNGQVLLGKRLSKHGTGTWAPPGGHLEFGESIQLCASREFFEETGLRIPLNTIETFATTNDMFYDEDKHYVTIHCRTKIDDSQIKNIIVKEPNKCETWQWFDLNKLPNPMFLSAQNLLNQKVL